MITYQIAARKLEIDEELTEYIERKLARLDKYFPRKHQPIAMKVELRRDEAAQPDKRYHIMVHIEIDGPDMIAETATINPHSAIDIVEAKLKEQIRKYKDKHSPRRLTFKRQVSQIDDNA